MRFGTEGFAGSALFFVFEDCSHGVIVAFAF